MLSTPALDSVSFGLFFAATECDAPVMPVMRETSLALLLRPLALDMGSEEKGIVPPFEACLQMSDKSPR